MQTAEQATTMKLMHQSPITLSEPRRVPVRALLPFAVVCGGLLWVSYFPLNWGWCAWFALVPLLALVRAPVSGRAAGLLAFAAGLVFYIPALKWMRVAHPYMFAAWIALAAYCALYFALAVWALRSLDRLNLPLALTLPLVWVALEYLRAHFLSGFAWYFLGYTQHDYLPLIQVADLGGVYAVSLLVAAVNGLLFDWVSRSDRFRAVAGLSAPAINRRRLALATALVALLLGGSAGYGAWRLSQRDFDVGPRVTMLQSNIAQDVKNERGSRDDSGRSASEMIIQHTKDLTDDVLRQRQNPDLIVWPETTFVEDWLAAEPGTPADQLPPWLPDGIKNRQELVTDVTRYSRTNVLLGLNTIEFYQGMHRRLFNSALLVRRDGCDLGRYDKIHCVPFGEFVPAREALPFMAVFSPYKHDYSLTPGEHLKRLALPTARGEFRFGVLICYEDSDPVLAREYARASDDGPPADFLVNISNDGWFDGTEEHELHMAVCRFRAVEARRAVVRSVNMGISGVIDGNGRVIALPGPTWRESKKVAAVVTADIPLDRRGSVYAWAGDWLTIACAAGCVGLMALARWHNLRRTDPLGMADVAART